MTGYGKGIAEGGERKVVIEMKAVNHRYLDLLFKLPKGFAFCEEPLRALMNKRFTRGHFDIYCSYEDCRNNKSKAIVNYGLALQYKEIGEKFAEMGMVNDVTASQVLRLPDVVTTCGEEDDEIIIQGLVLEAASMAVSALEKMREKEGRALKKDILAKLVSIENLTAEVKERTPSVTAEYTQKIKQRITDYLAGIAVDETRLLNEVAFFCDKSSIDEEITRLSGHIEHARCIISEKVPVGKKLDFLVQEMNREVNTIGSKCCDLYITQRVLLLKSEIEKIREQVQNIE